MKISRKILSNKIGGSTLLGVIQVFVVKLLVNHFCNLGSNPTSCCPKHGEKHSVRSTAFNSINQILFQTILRNGLKSVTICGKDWSNHRSMTTSLDRIRCVNDHLVTECPRVKDWPWVKDSHQVGELGQGWVDPWLSPDLRAQAWADLRTRDLLSKRDTGYELSLGQTLTSVQGNPSGQGDNCYLR